MHRASARKPAGWLATTLLFGVPAVIFAFLFHWLGPDLWRQGTSWWRIFHLLLVLPLALMLLAALIGAAIDLRHVSWRVLRQRLRGCSSPSTCAERQSSPADDDDAGLCFARTMAWPRLGLNLWVMQGDEVQRQVAEAAKSLYQRTNELVVLRARAITRRSWSSPLMFGCRRRGAAPDRVHAAQHRRVFRVDGGCLE